MTTVMMCLGWFTAGAVTMLLFGVVVAKGRARGDAKATAQAKKYPGMVS